MFLPGTALPALAFEGYACYSAWLAPAAGAASLPHPPSKANVRFQTIAFLPDWMVMLFAQETIAASPNGLLKELEQQKALLRAFEDANLKKPAPSTRP